MLLNAESVRETPAMVSFGDKQRFIGVHAAGKVRRARLGVQRGASGAAKIISARSWGGADRWLL